MVEDATHSSVRVIETRLNVGKGPQSYSSVSAARLARYLGSRAGGVLRRIDMTSRTLRTGMLPRSVQLQSV